MPSGAGDRLDTTRPSHRWLRTPVDPRNSYSSARPAGGTSGCSREVSTRGSRGPAATSVNAPAPGGHLSRGIDRHPECSRKRTVPHGPEASNEGSEFGGTFE